MSVVRGPEIDVSNERVSRIAALFGIERAERLGGFENLLFRSTDPKGLILRLTHGSRRSVSLIQAEFDFVAHLASKGLSVASPVRSTDGRWVEEFDTADGAGLIATCTREAPGRYRSHREWTEQWIESYGALIGSMHHIATAYKPIVEMRPLWTDPVFDVGLASAADIDPPLYERWTEIRSAAEAHPAGGDDLLIHQDAHLGNLFVTDNGQITLFDFDDSAYGTSSHEVAIVLFYWLLGLEDCPTASTRRFIGRFMHGYERSSSLPTDWPEGVDLFLTYREAEIYWLLSTESPQDMSPAEHRFMIHRRDRLLQGVPYVDAPLAEIL